MADQFVPTAWDNAGISEGCFISRIAKGGYYYTRLEWHKWSGETYVVSNELYRADMYKAGSREAQDILGVRVPLATIYPLLEDEVTITGVEASLFSYFRTPTANNIDDNSPLGVSIYANSMETLHALDIAFDSFVREFRLGKKRIIVPARMVKTVIDPETGTPRRFFDATDETYEALTTDDPDSLKIQDNSVSLRVEEHVEGINALLNLFCLQVGLSFGTFSFDAHGGIKTATEVVSENSKTYKTVKNYQNMIRPAVERLVDNIIAVAALYDMETDDGLKIADLRSRGYSVNIAMDDGVTQDRQTNINEGMALVGAGLMSKKTFLTDPKYGQALTPEAADAELQRIADERNITGSVVDLINLQTAE
jgi:A118 family predicted phage portal protein